VPAVVRAQIRQGIAAGRRRGRRREGLTDHVERLEHARILFADHARARQPLDPEPAGPRVRVVGQKKRLDPGVDLGRQRADRTRRDR
jgi:hypothetical protein